MEVVKALMDSSQQPFFLESAVASIVSLRHKINQKYLFIINLGQSN